MARIPETVRRPLRRVWYVFFRRHPYYYLGALLWATLMGDEKQRLQKAFDLVSKVPRRFRAWCLLYYLDSLYYAGYAQSPTLPEPSRLRWTGALASLTHRQLLEHYSRNPDAFEREYGPTILHAQAVLQQASFDYVVELGCGNGLLIERLAARETASAATFVGLDMDPETTAANQERYRGSRVQYHRSDTLQAFLGRVQPASVLVLASGTLQCFTEAELLSCLRGLVAAVPRGAVVAREFTYPDHQVELASRPAGGFTFFHNYEHLFTQAGLEGVRTQVTESRPIWNWVVVSAGWARTQ